MANLQIMRLSSHIKDNFANMKKIYLLLSVFASHFTSCETDFDVNVNWRNSVVYGLLDSGTGQETQQIKISKAFLGKMDAYANGSIC